MHWNAIISNWTDFLNLPFQKCLLAFKRSIFTISDAVLSGHLIIAVPKEDKNDLYSTPSLQIGRLLLSLMIIPAFGGKTGQPCLLLLLEARMLLRWPLINALACVKQWEAEGVGGAALDIATSCIVLILQGFSCGFDLGIFGTLMYTYKCWISYLSVTAWRQLLSGYQATKWPQKCANLDSTHVQGKP